MISYSCMSDTCLFACAGGLCTDHALRPRAGRRHRRRGRGARESEVGGSGVSLECPRPLLDRLASVMRQTEGGYSHVLSVRVKEPAWIRRIPVTSGYLSTKFSIVSQEQNVTPSRYMYARKCRACLFQTCAKSAHVWVRNIWRSYYEDWSFANGFSLKP